MTGPVEGTKEKTWTFRVIGAKKGSGDSKEVSK